MLEVNEKNFLETVAQGVTLVDAYAEWCGPCKVLMPLLERISEEVPEVQFIKVNADDSPGLLQRLKVRSLPTVVIFKDGEEVDRFIGHRTRTEILALLDEI